MMRQEVVGGMIEEGLNIDTNIIGDISVSIQKRRGIIREQLDNIKKEIYDVNNKWNSIAQGEISMSYEDLPDRIEAFDKDLDTYAKSLREIADKYNYVEKQIASNAESFH